MENNFIFNYSSYDFTQIKVYVELHSYLTATEQHKVFEKKDLVQ